jgi:hypothetical protein
MNELKTCVTYQDVLEINALLDMQVDINYQNQLEASKKK